MSDATPKPPPEAPVAQERDFWMLMAYAILLGIFGAFFALVFLLVTVKGGHWYKLSNEKWWGGHWWWVAVTAAAGVLVGLLRNWTKLPMQTSTLLDELQAEHIEPSIVPGVLAVGAVSLMGGASIGPEKALGTAGGFAGGWIARKRRLSAEDSGVNTLAGFGGAYGGLFSSTVIVVAFIMELANPGSRRFRKALPATILSSTFSFSIYFVIGGAIFLDAYKVPPFTFHDWQLAAGVGFGLLAALVVAILGIFVAGSTRLFGRMKVPNIVKSTIGGILFGIVGVALPLTMFTGSDQLKDVLKNGAALGAGLLVAILIGKMFAFSVSAASGFVGGPIFPTLFIGGTAAVAFNQLFPAVPLGLVFACLLAAVPGALVSAPFSMVLVAAFMTNIGVLQTAPVFLAVITAYLTMEAVKFFLASRQKEATRGAAQAAHDPPHGDQNQGA